MRDLIMLVAVAALVVPGVVPPAFGHEKPLPPAFGKELVPDEETDERNEPKAAELEESEERRERPAAHAGGERGPHGKVHIQLDGDEDGGGDDDDDDGEY